MFCGLFDAFGYREFSSDRVKRGGVANLAVPTIVRKRRVKVLETVSRTTKNYRLFRFCTHYLQLRYVGSFPRLYTQNCEQVRPDLSKLLLKLPYRILRRCIIVMVICVRAPANMKHFPCKLQDQLTRSSLTNPYKL